MIHTEALLAIGVLFFTGLLADQVGKRTRTPRVTLLLLCGVAAGVFGVLPPEVRDLTDTIMVTALTLVAFLLGGSLQVSALRSHGRIILVVSMTIVAVTLVTVAGGLAALGAPLPLALVLAAIATATAPAATLDVIRQLGISNRFTTEVKGIVAIDDAWGLLCFSLCLALAAQMTGNGARGPSAVWEILGAIGLGTVIGLPAAALTGRISQGEPLQIEALGIAFLSAGLAIWLEVSFLITGMVVGALIVNLASHHRKAFHEIEHIQWPFMILFFILAGAALEPELIPELGAAGAAFVVLRVVARLAGGWLGARFAEAPAGLRPLYGMALMPQAGVAIGMALIAGQVLPDWREQIMVLTVGSTVVFELTGPFCTMWAVRRSDKDAKT